jgi:predicted nucleic acid-binding protein
LSVLLDTSILVDILRGFEPAIAYAQGLRAAPTCSEITRVEILRGLRSDERRSTERLFATIRWIGVDEPIARAAGELGRTWRRSHQGLATADLVIAATASTLDLRLATLNLKHFPMLKGLRAPYSAER